jgi:hypothetical protein
METRPHRIASLIWASLFALLTVTQLVRHGHPAWIILYLAMIVLMLMNVVRRLPVIVCILPMVASLLAAVLIWPDEFQGYQDPLWAQSDEIYIQQTIFLLLCAFGAAYLWYRSHRRIKRRL